MSNNLTLENYRIRVADVNTLTLHDAKVAVETIDRGLWQTEHGVLRDDVSSVRHELHGAKTLSDKLRGQVLSLIERFSALEVESLNQELLDDDEKPKGESGKSKGATPVPPPTDGQKKGEPTDKGDPPVPASDSTKPLPKGNDTPKPPADSEDTETRLTKVEKRLDGHDRRHENAEANLEALNGAVGIVKKPDGSWVPTPDGQFTRNAKVQEHLGFKRDNNGKVSFADRAVQQFKGGPTIGTLIAVVVIGYVIAGAIWGWFSVPALVIVPVLGMVAAAAVAVLSNRSPKSDDNNDNA